MATLDDKLLGEKLHYYCSSSEDEGESGDEGGRGGGSDKTKDDSGLKFYPVTDDGPNTGPKGVINDWRRYKQLETEHKEEADAEKLALAKKLALTCRTEKEDSKAKAREEEVDLELEALLDDDFLENYMAQRMREMMAKTNQTKKFGNVVDLADGEAFLNQIDEEDKSVTVIIMIYEPGAEGCEAMNGCVECLAQDYPSVKFCRILSSAAGLSKHFKASGIPALLIYKAGQVLGSFVRMTDQLGTDFFAPDVESILAEHGLLPDREAVPSIIRGPQKHNDGGDDDED